MKVNMQVLVIMSLFLLAGCNNDGKTVMPGNYITEYVHNVTRLDIVKMVSNHSPILLFADGDRVGHMSEASSRKTGKYYDIPCITESCNSINVITNKDYDLLHPAGSNINEIVHIGYHEPLQANVSIMESLLEFNRKNPHSFISYNMELGFISLPKISGTYSFTIEYIKENNEKLTTIIDDVILDACIKN